MNIILCPDKFKGSLSSEEVCESLRDGILSTHPKCSIIAHPIADGGDGSVEIIKNRLDLKEVSVCTVDPLGREMETSYFVSKDAAFIELANASGLTLLQDYERNPLFTSTRGTGLIIKDALENGYKKIYLFIGGSASNDGGIGIAQALGFDFLSENGDQLEPIGSSLVKINRVQNNQHFDFENIQITVLCDVTNPMHGYNGAAHTYARQKGATDEDILTLDRGLIIYSNIIKQQFNKDLGSMPGMGAAGAVGASLVGILNAELQNGFQMLADLTHLEMYIQNADLVITGEGKIDQTSYQGKVVGNILSMCRKHGKPCGLVGGIIDDLEENKVNFLFTKSIISHAESFNDAMTSPRKYLFDIGEEIGILIKSL